MALNIASRLSNLSEGITKAAERFTMAVLYITLLTLVIAVLVIFDKHTLSDESIIMTIFYLGTGALLWLAFYLITEDRPSKPLHRMIIWVLQALWLGFSYYVAFVYSQSMSISRLLVIASSITLIVGAGLLIPFFKQKNDVPLWMFINSILSAGAIAWLSCLAMVGGVFLLFGALDALFGIQIHEKAFATVADIFLVGIAPLIFLMQIPEGENKYTQSVRVYTPIVLGIMRYLFIPLICIYITTLYFYAAKIIITWQLPNGWVSWLVIVVMASTIVITYLFYPYLQTDPKAKAIDRIIIRLLPILVLPLLVLWTIAITRRISDYGITMARLYVVVINLWSYAMCIALILTKSRRINFILGSAVVVFFLTSVGPWSMYNITRHVLESEVRQVLTRNGITKLPMNKKAFDQFKKKNKKDFSTVAAKLAYLYHRLEVPKSDLKSKYTTDDIMLYSYLYSTDGDDDLVVKVEKADTVILDEFMVDTAQITIPTGYTKMRQYDLTTESWFDANSADFIIPLENDDTLRIPKAVVAKAAKAGQIVTYRQGDELCILNRYTYKVYGGGSLLINNVMIFKK